MPRRPREVQLLIESSNHPVSEHLKKEFGDTLKVTEESTLARDPRHQSQLDLECQKLKESYSQHRKSSLNRSQNRSASNVRKASRSIGRRALNLNNTESQEDFEFGGETSTFCGGNKENANTNSGTNLQNRYKRNPNDKSLSNYQEKYNKLEENFKRFTQGLQVKR